MKISYDHIADALSITFKEGVVSETKEIAPEVNLDVDAIGTPLYLEIIGASEKLGKEKISELLVQNIVYQPEELKMKVAVK